MRNIIKRQVWPVWAAVLLAPSSTLALQSMSDEDMSAVAGRDGLAVSFSSSQITADEINYIPDEGNALESELSLQGVTISSVDLGGTNVGVGDFTISGTLDAAAVAGEGAASVNMTWDRIRTRIDDIRHGTDAVNTLGTMVLDSSGSFELTSNEGWLNQTRSDSRLYLAINDADLYYRQGAAGSPEMLLSNTDFLWDMTSGKVGVDSEGLIIEGDANFNLTFDLRYEEAPVTAFTNDANDPHGLRFGWTGGLQDTQIRLRAGGLWQESSLSGSAPNQVFNQSDKSEGLYLSMRWDYQPTFRWVIGESDGTKTSLEFGNWTKLPDDADPDVDYGFDFPLVAMDMINAGEGPGGICWGANWSGPSTSCTPKGGQYIDVAPENNALALVTRDGQLRAYSTEVNVLDPLLTDTYQWGLIYTWGDIDANIFIYPGGDGTATGMKMDLLIANQTYDTEDFDNDGNLLEYGEDWSNGTHFLIADTDENQAIGFLNSSFLMAANDVFFSLETGAQGGIQLTTNQARLAMNGLFGGGTIPDNSERLSIARWKIDLEMDNLEFAIYPESVGTDYLGFRGYLNLINGNTAGFSGNTAGDVTDDGSFISLAEPSRPDTDFRLADMRGTLEIRNGKVDLVSEGETPAGRPPELVIAQEMLIGQSATGGSALIANRVELGNKDIGSIVIPGGQWYSELTLSPQY